MDDTGPTVSYKTTVHHGDNNNISLINHMDSNNGWDKASRLQSKRQLMLVCQAWGYTLPSLSKLKLKKEI